MGKVLGIDLGTTNSVMAIWDGREPRVLVNASGSRLTPSVVAFGADGSTMVGDVARRQSVTNAQRTVSSVKRFMGRSLREVSKDVERAPYRLEADSRGQAVVSIDGRQHTPPEISAHVLRTMKEAAEAFLDEPVDGAVITVPAYFNDAQRAATEAAGRAAGLDVKRIINEPTAAALAYGLDKEGEQIVAVYDFGGGTFDISILQLDENLVEVLASTGDTHLGGVDIDDLIVEYVTFLAQKETDTHLVGDPTVLQRLREAAEQAKIDLSSRSQTEINLPFLAPDTKDGDGPLNFRLTLKRETLERFAAEMIERTLDCCTRALEDAGKDASDIDAVVLVGGSSRIPAVEQAVTEFFGRKPLRNVNPDEVVAHGAAVQAGIVAGEIKGMVLLDVTSLSLGVETFDGRYVPVIPRNTTIPTEVARTFTTAVDGQSSVEVHVLQGEADEARSNVSLGRFDLSGLRPEPAGSAHIDVAFEIDLNGMVRVRACDRGTGHSETVAITLRGARGGAGHPALRGGNIGSRGGSAPDNAWASAGK
jgi:molecular chaperone DnaK